MESFIQKVMIQNYSELQNSLVAHRLNKAIFSLVQHAAQAFWTHPWDQLNEIFCRHWQITLKQYFQ